MTFVPRRENTFAPGRSLSRREFLRRVGLGTAGALLSGCLREATSVSSPTASFATASHSSTAGSPSLVSIARAGTYERKIVRQQVLSLLDGLGGLKGILRPGDRVVIKTNLTSGNHFQAPGGLLATECYMTHPEVVRAVAECARDAGAGALTIAEAVYDPESFARCGYTDIARDLGAALLDLNAPAPYDDFTRVPVGAGSLVYDAFTFHRVLAEADCFISIAKLKCHYDCGVTLSMKNLVGLLPVSEYRTNAGDWWRSALHGDGGDRLRLPRAIVDLNRARPIHLAVVDGIMTAEGNEVPRGSFRAVKPGVLLAGKNAVATDAIATAVMSFDPTVRPPTPPFLRGGNYLNLAVEQGLGTNRVEEIAVVGTAIEDVRFKFNPASTNG